MLTHEEEINPFVFNIDENFSFKDVAQRWLGEVKGYYVAWEFNMNISSLGQELYDFTNISVYVFVDSEQGNICKCKLKENYKTIEEALEAGIKKCLEKDSITDKCSEE